MEVRRLAHAAAFLAELGGELERDEVRHSLLLGIAGGLSRAEPGSARFFAVRDARGPVLAAIESPGRPLAVESTREEPGSAPARLVAALASQGTRPASLVAAPALADHLVDLFRDMGLEASGPPLRQRFHVLTGVAAVPRPAGGMRAATAEDVETVAAWMEAFEDEAFGSAGAKRTRAIAARRVAGGEIRLWQDAGEARAMAGWARPTRNGVAVNSVYTPPGARGRGYATALVADLSQSLLDDGRSFCVLYTDAANATANAIYARIGYHPLAEVRLYHLAGRDRPGSVPPPG